MKKIYSIFTVVALVILAAVSCAKEASYEAAEAPTGAQYFFPSNTVLEYTLTPETEAISLDLSRVSASQSATVNVAVADTSKLVYSAGSATLSASFAAESKTASVSIPVDYEAFEFNDKVGVSLTIDDKEVSKYGISTITIVISKPEPWTLLGTGYLTDAFTFSSKYLETLYKGKWAEVEIYSNDINPSQFKIVAPYDGYLDFYEGDADPNVGRIDELILTILKAGDKPNPNGEAVAEDGCVYWPLFSTEIYGAGQDIYPLHPSSFTSLATAENYSKSTVTSYQENGLPAMIVLDPYWYVLTTEMGTVGGWGFGYPITIAFPGVPVNDFSVDIEYEALLSGKDGVDLAIATATLGEDVTEAVIAIAPGEDPNAAFALILAEDESVITVTESGEVKIPLPEEVAEAYSIVIVPVVDGEILPEEATYDVFAYKDFSISVVASEPVLNDDEVSSTVEASFVFGEDVEYAKVAIFAKTAKEIAAEDLAVFDEEDNADVVLVKHSDDVVPFILSEVGNYTIVAVSYAYEKSWNISTAELEFVLVNPWETVGSASWTESFVGPWFGLETVSYDVELQEHNETPGFYRLVNIYGAAFPYNEDGDWDASKDYYLKLHAEDANHVWFETFDTGCNWGYGNFLLASDMGLYIEENGVDTVIAAVDAGQIPNTFGVKNGNVITFPIDAVLKAMAEYNGGGWYYGNHAAEWSITLNPAAPSSSPKKVSTRSLGSSEKYSARKSAVSIASGHVFGRTISKAAKIKAEL